MDFGMPFLLETNTKEECIYLCKELGLQFIEWNMNFPQCQLENLMPEKLNQLSREFGLYFTIHLEENLNISDFNERVKKAYLETVLKSIELAKKIHAPIINMHLAKGIYITLPEEKVYLFQKYRDLYMKNIKDFRRICEQAIGDFDITIAVENTDGFAEHEQQAIEMLLESKCFGLTLDIGHSHVAGDKDIPFFEQYRNKLVHMHAHDANKIRNHLAFGDGEIDLSQKLKLAREKEIRVVLETKTVEALTKTVQSLSVYLEKQ